MYVICDNTKRNMDVYHAVVEIYYLMFDIRHHHRLWDSYLMPCFITLQLISIKHHNSKAM